MTHALPRFRSLAFYFAALALFAIGAQSEALAQAKVDVKGIEFDMVQSPKFEISQKKQFQQKDWLEIEVKFQAGGSTARVAYLEGDLLFRYYVALRGGKILTGDITHVNVPLGQEIFSVAYLSPSSLERLTGKRNPTKNIVQSVAVEVLYQGQLVGGDITRGKIESFRQAPEKAPGFILAKPDTPFAPLYWDRYAEVKQQP